MGSCTIATSPAMQITMEMTTEKIGRSMKKWESMSRFPLAFRGRARRLRKRRRLLRSGRHFHRRSGRELHHAVDHDVVTRAEAIGDEPVLALPGPDLHRSNLGLVVL